MLTLAVALVVAQAPCYDCPQPARYRYEAPAHARPRNYVFEDRQRGVRFAVTLGDFDRRERFEVPQYQPRAYAAPAYEPPGAYRRPPVAASGYSYPSGCADGNCYRGGGRAPAQGFYAGPMVPPGTRETYSRP